MRVPGLRFCGGATKMVRPFPMNERYVEWSTPWPEAERMGSERIKFSSIMPVAPRDSSNTLRSLGLIEYETGDRGDWCKRRNLFAKTA